jgi:hypothetical protein
MSAVPPIKHKFHAIPTTTDGIRFDSKKEARVYHALKMEMLVGDVVFFLRQVPFHLPGGVKYVVDFQVFMASGIVRFIDAKGMKTESFKAKKRMVEAIYPIEIEVV